MSENRKIKKQQSQITLWGNMPGFLGEEKKVPAKIIKKPDPRNRILGRITEAQEQDTLFSELERAFSRAAADNHSTQEKRKRLSSPKSRRLPLDSRQLQPLEKPGRAVLAQEELIAREEMFRQQAMEEELLSYNSLNRQLLKDEEKIARDKVLALESKKFAHKVKNMQKKLIELSRVKPPTFKELEQQFLIGLEKLLDIFNKELEKCGTKESTKRTTLTTNINKLSEKISMIKHAIKTDAKKYTGHLLDESISKQLIEHNAIQQDVLDRLIEWRHKRQLSKSTVDIQQSTVAKQQLPRI